MEFSALGDPPEGILEDGNFMILNAISYRHASGEDNGAYEWEGGVVMCRQECPFRNCARWR